MRTAPPQLSFSSGEISPLLWRRPDFIRYKTGLRLCRGFLPLVQGGVTRMPGTTMRGRVHEDAPARLIEFQFSAEDTLILEFTPLLMRVWRYGELVMDDGEPYELATPYDADAIWRLDFEQSADVVFLADGVLPIHRLARFALDNWELAPAEFSTGPFRLENDDEDVTVQASASTGTITLTASSALFDADQVGALLRLRPTDFSQIPLWTPNTAVSVGNLRRYENRVYELTLGSNTGTTPPLHEFGDQLTDPGTRWKFVSDDVGIVRITAVASATSATAEVTRTVPKACVDDPTWRWSEGAWSKIHGYPGALAQYDQRLVAAGTISEPRTLYFSAVGDFTDFTPGVEADESFSYAIAGTNSLNRIEWIQSGQRGLFVGALGEVYISRSTAPSQVIGPTTTEFRLVTGLGVGPARPIAPDGAPIYITRDLSRLIELRYSFESDASIPLELSLAAEHIGGMRLLEIAWQSSPARIAWMRLATGDLAAMIYDPTEEVLGWALCSVADGVVESLAVSRSADGSRDVLTLVVRREIDGEPRRFVEEMAEPYGVASGQAPLCSAHHLFCASVWEDLEPSQDTFSVPHLAGRTVDAWTCKGAFSNLTVAANGDVLLPVPVRNAIIGLFDFNHRIETLDLQATSHDGSAMGRPKRVRGQLGLAVHRTAAGFVQTVERELGQGDEVSPPVPLFELPVAADLTELRSGVGRVPAPTGHSMEHALAVWPYGGAPLTITALVPLVEGSD